MQTTADMPVVDSYAPATAANPAYQAFRTLQVAFTLAPIVAGVDKFFHILTNWDQYLAPIVPQLTRIPAHTFMLGVGVIEVIAGLLVGFIPRIGAYIVSLWLLGIVVNLLLAHGFYDIALRDFGLCLGAFSLGRLADRFAHPHYRTGEGNAAI